MMTTEERMEYLEQRIAALEEMVGVFNTPSEFVESEPPPPAGPSVEEIRQLYSSMGYSWNNAKRQARRDHNLGFTLEDIKTMIEDGRRKNLRTIYKTKKPA